MQKKDRIGDLELYISNVLERNEKIGMSLMLPTDKDENSLVHVFVMLNDKEHDGKGTCLFKLDSINNTELIESLNFTGSTIELKKFIDCLSSIVEDCKQIYCSID